MVILNVIYQPNLSWRLLSPRHLAQALNDLIDTGSHNNRDREIIFLRGENHKKIIPLSQSNVFIFSSAPGYKRYHAFATDISDMAPAQVTKDEEETDNNQEQPKKKGRELESDT